MSSVLFLECSMFHEHGQPGLNRTKDGEGRAALTIGGEADISKKEPVVQLAILLRVGLHVSECGVR